MLQILNTVKINSPAEKKRFYQENITGNKAYAIVRCEGRIPHTVCIKKTTAIGGGERYLEFPNRLCTYNYKESEFTREKAKEIVHEFDYGAEGTERAYQALTKYMNGGTFYDIESLQVPNFLPEQFEIKIISEQECIEWLRLYNK